jgi:hypothetical protein
VVDACVLSQELGESQFGGHVVLGGFVVDDELVQVLHDCVLDELS